MVSPLQDARVGTLGSALTFAGQATASLLSHHPSDAPLTYLPTMDAVVAAVLDGTIDVGVLTSETSRTACTDTVARMLAGDQLFVIDEMLVPYHCALMGRPGTQLEDISHVGGHGSIRQCGEFLRTRLPQATAQMHEQNSVVAAREVLEGDGSSAVIATEALATELGLEIIETDVDGGALGGWWALSATLQHPDGADHLALRVEGSVQLEETLHLLGVHGLRIRTITNQPSGQILNYRYLITAKTGKTGKTGKAGPLAESTVAAFGASVVGVFSSATAP